MSIILREVPYRGVIEIFEISHLKYLVRNICHDSTMCYQVVETTCIQRRNTVHAKDTSRAKLSHDYVSDLGGLCKTGEFGMNPLNWYLVEPLSLMNVW